MSNLVATFPPDDGGSRRTETQVSYVAAPGPVAHPSPAGLADKYRVLGVMSCGGMGMLYDARHLDLGLEVVLKFVRPDLVGPDVLGSEWDSRLTLLRFQTEARALAALSGPHVVRIYDAGALTTTCPYLVMEKLRGSNLEQILLAQGPLAVEQALRFTIQACAGLSEAHAAGIVHCDVKPSNLFLAEQRVGPPVVKLVDFGIARIEGMPVEIGCAGEAPELVGSPAYMAPERLEGAANWDGRADVWSLGVVLIELLTGRHPFADASSSDQVATARRHSLAQASTALELIPPPLRGAIRRCLEPDPDDRYSSMEALSDALCVL